MQHYFIKIIFFYQNFYYNVQTNNLQLTKNKRNVTNIQHYLVTYAIKIVRAKAKRRNKLYNGNNNDSNSNNKKQF